MVNESARYIARGEYLLETRLYKAGWLYIGAIIPSVSSQTGLYLVMHMHQIPLYIHIYMHIYMVRLNGLNKQKQNVVQTCVSNAFTVFNLDSIGLVGSS